MQEAASIYLVNKACDIIADQLGENTASSYRIFLQNESPKEVIDSLKGLIDDLVGSENAKKQLKELILTTKK
jgi:hypothetical protein